MIEVEIQHSHTPDAAADRIRAAADRLDVQPIDHEAAGPHGGAMRKDTPLGSVVAHWEAFELRVVVRVVEKPAFLPEGTVRRLLEDGLKDALT